MWSKLKARFKPKEKQPAGEEICKNCETHFEGHYCPNCGQAVREYDKPFSFIFYNFVGDFFSFDTRFFRSLVALIVKPGFLTKEYFAGRRVRYAPPFRIYIFVSFVLFLLLQIYTNRGLTTVLDSDFNSGKLKLDSTSLVAADSIFTQVRSELDSTEQAAVDSLLAKSGKLNINRGHDDQDIKIDLETFRDTRDLRHALNQLAVSFEKQLETETDPDRKAELREYIRLCRSPESANAKILEYISWAFFLLLPIFALLLKLVYIRRKQNYMRHLIFSIHIHSFIFLIMTIVVALYLIFPGNLKTVSSTLILLVPVYFILAMKRFYGQNIGKVILKFFVVSFLYNIVFILVVGTAILNALNII